jgi:hypothetical protein
MFRDNKKIIYACFWDQTDIFFCSFPYKAALIKDKFLDSSAIQVIRKYSLSSYQFQTIGMELYCNNSLSDIVLVDSK